MRALLRFPPPLLATSLATLLATCLAMAAASAASVPAEPIVLRTAAQDNNTLKYELQAKNKGICVDVIKAIEQVAPGLRFNGWTQPMSLPRIEAALAEQRLDAFCALLRTSAREAKFTFIEIPVYTVRHMVAVRASDNVSVKSIDDIRKLGPDGVVIVSKGTAHEVLLQSGLGGQVDASSRDTVVNLRKLLHKRGRFYYHTENALRRYIADEQLGGMIKLLPTVFKEEALYFVVSRTLAPAAVEQLRQALHTLSERGELQKIYATYKEE